MRRDQGGRARWRYRGTLGRPRARRARLRGRRRREDGGARGKASVARSGRAPDRGAPTRYERRHPEDPVCGCPASTASASSPASTSTSSTRWGAYPRPRASARRATSCRPRAARSASTTARRSACRCGSRARPGDVGTVLGAVLAGFGPWPSSPRRSGPLRRRIWQLLTSCHERRLAEYEQIPLVEVHRRGVALDRLPEVPRRRDHALARRGPRRNGQHPHDRRHLHPAAPGHHRPSMPTSDRVLDGPTNEVWLYPWLQHLDALGVTYLPETAATEITYAGGRVSGVQVTSGPRHRDARGRLLRVRAARRTGGAGVRPRARGRRSAAGQRARSSPTRAWSG